MAQPEFVYGSPVPIEVYRPPYIGPITVSSGWVIHPDTGEIRVGDPDGDG